MSLRICIVEIEKLVVGIDLRGRHIILVVINIGPKFAAIHPRKLGRGTIALLPNHSRQFSHASSLTQAENPAGPGKPAFAQLDPADPPATLSFPRQSLRCQAQLEISIRSAL